VRNLTDKMRALSNKLNVKFVSPDVDPMEYGKLVTLFPQIQPDPRTGGGRGILVVSGPMPDKIDDKMPLYAFIAERKLSDDDRTGAAQPGGKNKRFFKGESELYKELKFLLQDRQKNKVYVLQGDDEPNLADDRGGLSRSYNFRTGFKSVGIGIFADKLRKDNFEVVGLTFQQEFIDPKNPSPPSELVHAKPEGQGTKKEIPKDCKTLIVAGVSRPLSSETLDAIERYMTAGGKMMVFLDVIANENFSKLKDSGLEPMMKQFGVEVTDQFALGVIMEDPEREDACELMAETPLNSNNPLPKQFADKFFYLPLSARILKPVETPGRYKAESIMELYPADKTSARWSMNFTEVPILQSPQKAMWNLRIGNKNLFLSRVNRTPAVVGAAVTNSNGDKPCLVVFGDTEFITNFELVRGKSALINYNMVAGALDWLAEREFTGDARPRESASFSINIPEDRAARMILLPGWLMLLTIVGLGVGIWVTRRR
jgi:hypothetical protein